LNHSPVIGQVCQQRLLISGESMGDDAVNTPKVSVIMPSLNVAAYIRECLESAVKQSLRDIEIICVDAGSTDGTEEILKEYAEKDARIHFIHSDVKSYGYQMNLGLDAARGEYIGVLETDDWVEPEAFETLWETARANDADVVMANYFWYTTRDGVCNKPVENLKNCPYNKVFTPLEERELYKVTPSIWSGIYRRELLSESNIRFNETPGASFQDTSFHFMVCTAARRCCLLNRYFLHYRRDNEGSSVHSKGKIFCVSDEAHYFEAFLERRPSDRQKLAQFWQALKYEKYRWNFERLDEESRQVFVRLMCAEFLAAREAGTLEKACFTPEDWIAVNQLISRPERYCRMSFFWSRERKGAVRRLYGMLRDYGLCATLCSVGQKIQKRDFR